MSLAGYTGHIDKVEPTLEGWVVDIRSPAKPVALRVSIDGEHQLFAIADRPRPDVADAGRGSGRCGFAVPLPADLFDGEEHKIELMLADGRRLDLPGPPLRVALGTVEARIVPVTPADWAAIADLLRRTNSEGGYDPAAWTDAGVADWIAAVAAPSGGAMFAARVGQRLVGYSRIERGRGAAGGIGAVALTVLAAYRRKGLGERLMRTLIDAVREQLDEIWLAVEPVNLPAIRLYEKLGFVYRRERPADWTAPAEFLTMMLRTR